MFSLMNSHENMHTVAEINLSAFRSNLQELRKKLSDSSKILAVIKTNAYGHGIVPIAKEAVNAGADRLGVTTIAEGAKLRKSGIYVPIHLLSAITPEQSDDVVLYDLIGSISNGNVAKALNQSAVQQKKIATVHLKLDTGLHRFGLNVNQVVEFCKEYNSLSNLYWEGIYTHFSHADEGDWLITEKQFRLFQNAVGKLERYGFTFPIKHIGASTIVIECEKMHLDMVRPGIALFGYQPASRQIDMVSLTPVLTLKTKIIQLHSLPAQTPIGYGGQYVTERKEKIAVLPIGHGDGYKRGLSNKGFVLVQGKFAKIVGTIALDQTFVNVTNIPNVKEGDEVILIGSQGKNSVTARDIANWIDSNIDEVLASLMDRVQRIYV